MNPNSTHQCWSKWTFVFRTKRTPSTEEVRVNASRFFRQLFQSSVGQIRVRRWGGVHTCRWRVELRIEGPPVHDPTCVSLVRQQFEEHFLRRGFGVYEFLLMEAAMLAGSKQDGTPTEQLIVMPYVNLLGDQ